MASVENRPTCLISERKHTTMDLLTIAKEIADHVEAESGKEHIPVAVTVIDVHGNVVLTHRMTGAPIWFPAADRMLWDMVYGEVQPAASPDGDLADHTRFRVAGTALEALHTPGHSPGSTCLHAGDLRTVFTGDTLFCGGPGATGRSYSDKPTILTSIRARLMTLHGDTVVRTGHGDDTTVAAEIGHIV